MLTLDKVLHVEDDESLRLLMKMYLKDCGGPNQEQWFEAASVEGALRIVDEKRNSFQVVIVDLNLEDSWGIETLRALRPCTDSPFVVCTGMDVSEVIDRAVEFGVYGVIDKNKSFTRERLRPVIFDAYRTWRDERLLLPLQEANERLKTATERRIKALESYGHKG